MYVLKSRKLWAAVVAILFSTGILQGSEAAEADMVNAILTVVTAAFYIFSVALEDGLSFRNVAFPLPEISTLEWAADNEEDAK